MRFALPTMAAIAAFGLSPPASAGPILAPVPVANFITLGGLDWAWASPCAFSGSSCGVADMTFQTSQGWRIPTLSEFLARPKVSDFGTVDNFRCASAWFSPSYTHCDYSDPGNDSGSVNSAGQPMGFLFDFGYGISHVGDQMNYDTWLVRDPDFNPVPEPATWALMLVGFGLAGAAMRRRSREPLAASQ